MRLNCPPITVWLCLTLGKSWNILGSAVLLCKMRSGHWGDCLPAPDVCIFLWLPPSAPLPSLPLLMGDLPVLSLAFPWPRLMGPEMGAFPRVLQGQQAGGAGGRDGVWSCRSHSSHHEENGHSTQRRQNWIPHPWFLPPLKPKWGPVFPSGEHQIFLRSNHSNNNSREHLHIHAMSQALFWELHMY